MEQLLLHLFGDFILQNDWMAVNKKKPGINGFWACFVHCVLYSLPFLVIASPPQVLLIYLSHFVLDRYNLVTVGLSIRNNCGIDNFGFGPERPIWLTVWLNIITDNTLHLIGNYLIILLVKF